MREFQGFGDWWLPDCIEHKVSGQVNFDPINGVEIILKEPLLVDDETKPGFLKDETNEIPIIHGELKGGKKITIQDAIQTSRSFGSGPNKEEYISNRMFSGAYLSKEASFQKLRFNLPNLPDWMNKSVVRPIINTDKLGEVEEIKEDVETGYVITSPKSYNAKANNAKVRFTSCPSVTNSVYSVNIESIGSLEVIPNNRKSFNWLFDYGFDVLRFVSLGIGSGIFPENIYVYDSDSEYQTSIEVFEQMPNYRSDMNVGKPYLFKPDEIDIDRSVQKWMDHREEAPIVHEHHDMLLHGPDFTPRLRFMTVVIALESYHRSKYGQKRHLPEEEYEPLKSDILDLVSDKSSIQNQLYGLLENVVNEPSLKDKLQDIFELEEDIIDRLIDIEQTISEARTHRHKIAHGSEQVETTTTYNLANRLQMALEVLLLREIGVSKERVITAIANKY